MQLQRLGVIIAAISLSVTAVKAAAQESQSLALVRWHGSRLLEGVSQNTILFGVIAFMAILVVILMVVQRRRRRWWTRLP